MRFGITGHFRSTLARGTAVLVLGGLAAGCSTGAASLTDGLVTNSTTANRPVTVARSNQPYPGDIQTGRRTQPTDYRVVRPKVPVGNGVFQSAAPTQLPPPTSVQPVYNAPAPSRSTVSSSPLPPPQSPQNQRAAAAPVATPQPTSPARSSSAIPSGTAPQQPSRQPSDQLAVLPQAPKPQQAGRGEAEGNAARDSTISGAYTVVSGDTLYGISRKTGVDVESIKQANGLSGGMIRVGQRLTIPHGNAVKETVVASNGSAGAQASKPAPVTTASAKQEPASKVVEEKKVSTYTPPSDEGVSDQAEEQSTEVAALAPDSTGVGHLRWPASGRVVSAFGASSDGRSNDGIDIAVPEGTSVRAAENGVVIYAGDGLKGFGNTVLVRHEDGLVTVYGHASELKVQRGDKIKRGQEIALSGMTGDADRPKLHFEVRKGTSPVDPMTYLER